MSKNLHMVELFLNDFYRLKRIELVETISPEFYYYSPICGKLNFAEYVEFMSGIASYVGVVHNTEISENGAIYNHQFTLKILDFVDGFDEELTGKTTIFVKNDLIENVVIDYPDEILNVEKFKRIKTKMMG